MPFLIDGHNVIAALPDIDLEDPHDEAKLVLKLRAWTGQARRKAIVIFDGGIPGGYSTTLSKLGGARGFCGPPSQQRRQNYQRTAVTPAGCRKLDRGFFRPRGAGQCSPNRS